jgi:hypothetical protein
METRAAAMDHATIEGLLASVIDALEDGGADAASRWNAFERALDDHVAYEEKTLMASLVASSPREARVILQEHNHLQRRARQLRAMLPAISAEVARTFLDELRAHGAHEQKVLHRWAVTAGG